MTTSTELADEAFVRTTAEHHRWTGDFQLELSDAELCRALATEVDRLRVERDALVATLTRAREALQAIVAPDDLLDENPEAFSPMAARRMQEQARWALDQIAALLSDTPDTEATK